MQLFSSIAVRFLITFKPLSWRNGKRTSRLFFIEFFSLKDQHTCYKSDLAI